MRATKSNWGASPKASPSADVSAWLRQKTAEARTQANQKAQKAAEIPQPMFLPGMDEVLRAMPNHIARSSLFAPVAPGRKKILDDAVLVSRSDAVIRFKGRQLDEAQADVWMQAMHEASKEPLGKPVTINRASFLKAIGRSTQGENYKWLHRSLEDLVFAMLVIEVRTRDGMPKWSVGKAHALHMIDSFDYDSVAGTYTLRIDPRWHHVYSNREFALIDWNKRLKFRLHQNIAKALQRLFATSSDSVQRYELNWLKDKLAYTSPTRKFRETLGSACKELEWLEIVNRWNIQVSKKGKNQLVVWLSEPRFPYRSCVPPMSELESTSSELHSVLSELRSSGSS